MYRTADIKEMWLWEETWRESLTFSCIQKSFNASKDIQGWVNTVNLNLLTQPISLLSSRTQVWHNRKNKQTNITKTKKQNRINFIGSITAGFEIYRRIGWNLFRTDKIVSKPHIPKETVQVIFNQKLEQELAVAGLVVKKQNKRVQENV